MLDLAARHRGAPDAKVRALVEWIRRNQCPAVDIGGADANASKADRQWTDRRLLIFTEYGDTKRYLRTLLNAAIDGTDRGDERVMELHGGMSDEQREEVQRAFNAPPDKHPARILLATDAAREGVNLQGHCADLIHFDVPWNPARIEQRNGRIDRTWRLPDLPESWQDTLDSLRPARGRNEPFWDFRKKPPLPVVFRPPPKVNSELAHLHLQHPLVQRVLGRFLSQGYSAHDLSRVTVVRTRHDSLVRVIAFGRLLLFGTGAMRLHDQLVSVAARWIEGKEDALQPFAEEADRKAVEMLEQVLAESPTLEGVSASVQSKLVAAAPKVFARLWRFIREEADALAHAAEQRLGQRGTEESEALREILSAQRMAIIHEIERRAQLTFDDLGLDKRELDQFEKEKQWMGDRLVAIQLKLEREPKQIEQMYKVALRRLEPVGLVFLWPETRG
jgi:hypothetical protein